MIEQMKMVKMRCQFDYEDQLKATQPNVEYYTRYNKMMRRMKQWYLYRFNQFKSQKKLLFSTLSSYIITNSSQNVQGGDHETTNLQPGDWVEVRSVEEIFNTLDEHFKNRGMVFMPEMIKYCGKRFKVYKKVKKIMLETPPNLSREIKSPTVFLEGNYCDGEYHNGCDRSCFCFWREVWLKRVEPD